MEQIKATLLVMPTDHAVAIVYDEVTGTLYKLERIYHGIEKCDLCLSPIKDVICNA